jgi:hypothetical protein
MEAWNMSMGMSLSETFMKHVIVKHGNMEHEAWKHGKHVKHEHEAWKHEAWKRKHKGSMSMKHGNMK